jgi:PKD domain
MVTLSISSKKCLPDLALTKVLFSLIAVCGLVLVTSCGDISAVGLPPSGTTTSGTTPTPPSPPPPPTGTVDAITISITASPSTGVVPLLVTLAGTATSSSGSVISSWSWSFGDGTSCNNEQPLCGLTVSHSFSNAGSYNASLFVADEAGTAASAYVTVMVSDVVVSDPDDLYCGIGDVPIGAAADGPADMPLKCVNSSLANTPSPGAVITLPAGGNFQTAYNGLLCGQTLSLAHGATWNGPFQFTPKGCDDQHWITISSDGVLPPAGTRVDATSLPEFAFISMAPGTAANTVTGDHVRFIGIGWLKQAGNPLVAFVAVPGAVKVVFDRNYAHGNPGEETRRFINLTNGSYIAVVESFIDEMHCIALTGTCTDSQAISGGTDTFAAGPFKIVNNYLSAAGENILLGGGSATNTPCDIEIRNNYMYKPISWNPLDPTYIGTPYIVKNLFELKNACRTLVEGNVLANTWGGFSQDGSAFLIGPKNQEGANDANVCPLCFVSDVIMRYNYITTAAAAFEIFNVQTPAGGWASGGHNYSIHDLLFDNLEYATCYLCTSNLGQMASGYLNTNPPPVGDVMRDVLISHLTLITVPAWPLAGSKQEAAMLLLDGPPNGNLSGTPQMSNITFENSLFGGGNAGFYPTGGGSNNCSVGQASLASMISACWAGDSLFSGNLVVGYTGSGVWPAGNLFSTSWSNVDFVNYNNGVGGNYQLAGGSPFKGQALDGTDPGADIDLVEQYTQNAQQ